MAMSDDEIDQLVNLRIEERFRKLFFPDFRIYLFPGGSMPKRAKDGSVGFDFFLRAIVSPFEMESDNKILRRTLFNFKDTPNIPTMDHHIVNYAGENGNEPAYRLDPGESVLVGVGCTVEMDFPTFHWIAPRSGLATKWKITVTNAPGTVDPDYRGEAGVSVLNINDKDPILLTKDMKIAQAIFSIAVIPNLIQIENYEELTTTERGIGGFGSTGIR